MEQFTKKEKTMKKNNFRLRDENGKKAMKIIYSIVTMAILGLLFLPSIFSLGA